MEIQHLDGLGWPGASVTDHLQVTLCMYWYKGLGANPSGFCFWSVDLDSMTAQMELLQCHSGFVI